MLPHSRDGFISEVESCTPSSRAAAHAAGADVCLRTLRRLQMWLRLTVLPSCRWTSCLLTKTLTCANLYGPRLQKVSRGLNSGGFNYERSHASI